MTDIPAIRSRIEALADWLAEHVKTLPTETRVWPNKLAEYIDTLRTVLALLAGPGEEEVRALIQAARKWSPPGGVAQLLADAVERLAVRLEAETRAREELIEAARAVDATWMTVHGIGPQANENVGAAFNAACMDLHNVLRREIAR